jgi:hypothetical protein
MKKLLPNRAWLGRRSTRLQRVDHESPDLAPETEPVTIGSALTTRVADGFSQELGSPTVDRLQDPGPRFHSADRLDLTIGIPDENANGRYDLPTLTTHDQLRSVSPSQMGRGETLDDLRRHAITKAQAELTAVSAQFTEYYENFLAKHKQFIRLNDEICCVIRDTETKNDICHWGMAFKQHIENVLQVSRQKEEKSSERWHFKVGRWLSALYPIARISIGITTSMADVCSP